MNSSSQRLVSAIGLVILLCTSSPAIYAQDPVDYADPTIGTWGYTGGVIPGISHPFGMTHFTAMTRVNKVGNTPYHYEDSTYIIGFRATHQPTVWMGDYGYSTLMPGIGKVKIKETERKLSYSHKTEVAKVYSYETLLTTEDNRQVKAEVTGTSRCGYLRFTYPETNEAFLMVEAVNTGYPNVPIRRRINGKDTFVEEKSDLFHGFVEVSPEQREITGYNNDIQSHSLSPLLKNFRGYFVMKFNKPFKSFGTWKDTVSEEGSRQSTGQKTGAYFTFSTSTNEIIEVIIGTSFISLEQARNNIDDEIGTHSFEEIKSHTRTEWNKALSKITIETKDEVQKKLFYTFMYHAQQYPREIFENGKHYSPAFDTVKDGRLYTDFSLWDTYRAAHPLLIYLVPERVNEMINSLLSYYEGTGRLPVWPNPMETNIMIGSHADAVITDAYVKGIRDFDIEKAYQAIRKNGTTPPVNDEKFDWGDRDPWYGYEGRGGLTHYLSKGYVARDKTKESAARTLEYAYNDFCIAVMAKALGRSSDYNRFKRQSKYYVNVYDEGKGYFMARDSNGNFSADTHEGFTEGDFWVYAFAVQHDVDGLIKLMGGKNRFIEKLDSNYIMNKYKQHNNEQVHHYPYLYNYAGAPWKTQLTVTKTLQTYQPTPYGIGNEDCGQMSAWYIFSTLGFYPVTPGTDVLVIGSPQVEKATLHLGPHYNNRSFSIIAKNHSKENIYIQSATLNGRPLKKAFLTHQDIVKGGELVFSMSSEPNKEWGR